MQHHRTVLQNSHAGQQHVSLDGKGQDDLDSTPSYARKVEVDRPAWNETC